MTLNPAERLPIGNIIVALAAAFAALAVWAFAPSGGDTHWGSTDGSASLPPSLAVDGEVAVTTSGGSVTRLVVPLAVRGDDGIRLTKGNRLHASTFMSDTAAAAVPAEYTVTWTNGNGDEMLDPGEQAVLTVDLPSPSSVREGYPLELIIRPVEGIMLTVQVFD
jgi:hypothetical protein